MKPRPCRKTSGELALNRMRGSLTRVSQTPRLPIHSCESALPTKFLICLRFPILLLNERQSCSGNRRNPSVQTPWQPCSLPADPCRLHLISFNSILYEDLHLRNHSEK